MCAVQREKGVQVCMQKVCKVCRGGEVQVRCSAEVCGAGVQVQCSGVSAPRCARAVRRVAAGARKHATAVRMRQAVREAQKRCAVAVEEG